MWWGCEGLLPYQSRAAFRTFRLAGYFDWFWGCIFVRCYSVQRYSIDGINWYATRSGNIPTQAASSSRNVYGKKSAKTQRHFAIRLAILEYHGENDTLFCNTDGHMKSWSATELLNLKIESRIFLRKWFGLMRYQRAYDKLLCRDVTCYFLCPFPSSSSVVEATATSGLVAVMGVLCLV